MIGDSPFIKNSVAIHISREDAIGYGLVEPTPEERAEMDKRHVEYVAKAKAEWELYDAARPALAAITDRLARTIIDLHSSETIEHPTCRGCDMNGYDSEAPEWPCRTVQAVASHYDIELPGEWYLHRRP